MLSLQNLEAVSRGLERSQDNKDSHNNETNKIKNLGFTVFALYVLKRIKSIVYDSFKRPLEDASNTSLRSWTRKVCN